ncbi:hypothetical protein [Streptomyces sp. NPDC058373]|uniref:hypothetical protein n=1 Tax=Streptomyces sp. NPDC058373 TaxID=3346465 RepID=UPI003652B97C
MHRTRTAAALLATVALSAVSGCVTVDRAPGTGSPSGRSPAAAPPAEENAEPQIGQSPAREALRRVGDDPSAEPAPPPRPQPSKAAPPPRPKAPLPNPPHPDPAPATPAVPRAQLPAPNPPADADVCALGRQYGKWPSGSPQSRICDDAYGG